MGGAGDGKHKKKYDHPYVLHESEGAHRHYPIKTSTCLVNIDIYVMWLCFLCPVNNVVVPPSN